MNVTREYSKFAINTHFDDLPEEAIERFKVRLLDSIGVIAASMHAGGIDECVDLFGGVGGSEEATILFHGVRLPADKASLVNSMMARSFDYEPVGGEFVDGTAGAAHISGSSIPCMLAMGELVHASGKDAIAATVLGDDLATRLQQGTGFAFDKGWDNTGTFNGLGCTVLAAKLLGLDEDQCVNALGIDINTIGSTMDGVIDGVLAFKLPHGLSGMNAIMSARMAQRGFTGTKDALCGLHGYFDLFGNENSDSSTVLNNLGQRFYTDSEIKPWPSCRITHAPIQAVLELKQEHGFSADDVKRITVTLQQGNGSLVDFPYVPGLEIPNFNLRFLLALALSKGAVVPRYFEDEYQNDPEIVHIATKLVDVAYSADLKNLFSAEVKVDLADGRSVSTFVPQPKGNMAFDPLTREELMQKYYTNMEYSGVVSRERTDEIADAVEHFEEIEDVNDFVALMR